ncbi:hypothetical protein AGMMS50256_09090 [Betaproteobacteria bacterium]|nr:hypothetical protein AGMMS50256_09090 [Betaproteobacteria bacterium]
MSQPTEGMGTETSRYAEFIACAFITLIAIAAIVNSRYFPLSGLEMDVGPARFPVIYAGVLLILAAVLVYNTLRRSTVQKAEVVPASSFNFVPVVIGIVATGIYIYLIPLLGYLPPTVVFLIGMMWLMGMRHRLWNPVIAIGITLFLYLVFLFGLSIPLPMGSLFEIGSI